MSFFLLQCCCHRNPLNVVTPRSWLRELAKQEMMSTADEEFGSTDSLEPFQTETIHNGALLHRDNLNLIHYIYVQDWRQDSMDCFLIFLTAGFQISDSPTDIQ